MSTALARDHYRLIGPVYDWLGRVYSADAIHRCKVAMLDDVRPGERVLFAGAGRGRDALAAAERGAHVTTVDLSKTMTGELERAACARGLEGRIRQLHGDILAHDERYDLVAANFFLNVFARRDMERTLAHLAGLVAPGGRLVIGDFCITRGFFTRLLQRIYWLGAVLPFWLIAGNALHDVYDYAPIAERAGLRIRDTRTFSLFGVDVYTALRATKDPA